MARRPSSNPSTDSDEDEDELPLGPLAFPTDIRKLKEYLREYIFGTPTERAFLRRIRALRYAGLVGRRGFLFGDEVAEDVAYDIIPDELDEESCRRILAAAREEHKRAKDREYEEKRREKKRKQKRGIGMEAMMHSRAMQRKANRLPMNEELELAEEAAEHRRRAMRMQQVLEKVERAQEARLAEKRQREAEAEAAEAAAAAEKKQKQEALDRQRAAQRAAEEAELRRRAEERAQRLEAERQRRQRREMERQEMQDAVAAQTAAVQHMESFIRDATDQLEMLTAQIAGLDVEMASNSSVRERLEGQSRSGENFAEIQRLRDRFLFFRGEWEQATRKRNLLRNTIDEARRTLEQIRAQPPQQRYDLRKFSLDGPTRKF